MEHDENNLGKGGWLLFLLRLAHEKCGETLLLEAISDDSGLGGAYDRSSLVAVAGQREECSLLAMVLYLGGEIGLTEVPTLIVHHRVASESRGANTRHAIPGLFAFEKAVSLRLTTAPPKKSS